MGINWSLYFIVDLLSKWWPALFEFAMFCVFVASLWVTFLFHIVHISLSKKLFTRTYYKHKKVLSYCILQMIFTSLVWQTTHHTLASSPATLLPCPDLISLAPRICWTLHPAHWHMEGHGSSKFPSAAGTPIFVSYLEAARPARILRPESFWMIFFYLIIYLLSLQLNVHINTAVTSDNQIAIVHKSPVIGN